MRSRVALSQLQGWRITFSRDVNIFRDRNVDDVDLSLEFFQYQDVWFVVVDARLSVYTGKFQNFGGVILKEWFGVVFVESIHRDLSMKYLFDVGVPSWKIRICSRQRGLLENRMCLRTREGLLENRMCSIRK